MRLRRPLSPNWGLDPGFFRELGTGSGAAGAPPPSSLVDRARAVNRDLLARASRIEDQLAEDSVLGRRFRPVVQDMLTGWLRAGTSQVEIGVDGWLFYRPDIDHVTGPGFLDSGVLARRAAEGDTLAAGRQPDPRPALLELHEQLERRGVRLIVVPTPVKPSADPRQIGFGRFESELIMNRSYGRYVEGIQRAGVTVFDVSRTLSEMRREGAGSLYLATDTHWRPDTMQRTADELAAFIQREAALSEPAGGYRSRRVAVTNQGGYDEIARSRGAPGPLSSGDRHRHQDRDGAGRAVGAGPFRGGPSSGRQLHQRLFAVIPRLGECRRDSRSTSASHSDARWTVSARTTTAPLRLVVFWRRRLRATFDVSRASE